MKTGQSNVGTALLVCVAAAAVVALVACENPTSTADSGSNDNDSATTVDPPETIVGTVALSDGSSAVIELSFTTASAQITTLATHDASGSVRYKSNTYTASGSYDNSTAEASISATRSGGGSFEISGSWDPDEGFSGTVTYSDAGGNQVASGSINAAGVDSADQSSVDVYVGTYGGTAYGSWNGVVSENRFFGTYAAADGSGDRGSFSASYGSGSVSAGSAGPDGVPFGGEVSGSGESIGGWYAGNSEEGGETYYISGTWSGVQVDSSNDAPAIGTSSDGELIANRTFQAIGSLLQRALNTIDTGTQGSDYTVDGSGDFTVTAISNVTVALDAQYDGSPSEANFQGFVQMDADIASGGFADDVSGVTLGAGSIRATFDAAAVPSFIRFDTLDVDQDVDTSGDDNGITVTFPDSSTGNLYIEGTIDDGAESVGGTWEFESVDVSTTVQAVLF